MEETFLNNTDEQKLSSMIDATKDNAALFESTVNKVVKQYSSDLDDLMSDLRSVLTKEEAASTDTIERYYAELTNMLYFKSESLEQLNVYNDVTKMAAKEVYNKVYLQSSSARDEKGKSKMTVAENTATAENQSQEASVTSQMFEHAYKLFKVKIDAATEMVSTLKTILRKRVNEMYLNNQVSNIQRASFDE